MKNRIKKIVFSLIILVALIFGIGTLPIINVSADSVDLFWIPVAGSGTGNWSDTNHWAEYYTVGTASFVNGDATVEFGGGADVTSYDDCIIRVLSTGKWYTIDSITDSDTLELTEAFAEANTGAVAYAIAIGGHAVPTATNNVYFNIGSFTGASQVVTVDATAYFKDMDWTGATNNPTLAGSGSSSLQYYGSVTLISGMSITHTGAWSAEGSASRTFTTAGLTFAPLYFYFSQSGGTYTLSGNLNISTGQFHDKGYGTAVFNTTNYTITCGKFRTVGTSTLNLGSSIINCTSWDYSGSNLTLTANTSTINCSGNFSGGGETYNIVNLTGATSTISGSNTFAQLNLVSGTTQTVTFTDGTTQTAASFSLSGSAGHIHTLQGSGVAGWNLVYTGGSYLSFDYLSVSRSSVTPATNIWYAGTHSTNGGNNTGWFFIAPDAPTVTTQAASGILVLEATINGTITNKGALNTTLQYGFDIGTAAGVYTDSYVTVGDYSGAFLELVDGLLEHTTYYYRAKAQNNVGWGYGSEVSFTTGTETWSYYLEFTVQDTSGADRTNVPVILSSLIGSNLVNTGYIDSDGLDTNLKETTTAMEYLLSTTNGAMVIPNLAASQTRTYRLYLNDWQGQHGFPIIVGDEGYMTVLDAATLELGDNFEIEVSGYVDTDAGADKNIVFKDGSFLLYISAEDTVSARMYSSASPTVVSTSTDTQSNHVSGFNTSDVNLPADLVSGNLILVIGTYARDYTMDTPAGWTLLYNETYGNLHNFCIYKVSDGSEGATVTITFGSNIDDLVTISYQISDYSGVPVTNTVATGTSSNPDPSSITTGFDNIVSLFIAVEGHLGNYTVSNYPTNYASGLSARNSYYTVATAQRALTAASEDVGAFTISGSTGWIAKTIAIQGTYVEVSEAALVSDDYIIKVTADGTDLKLFIDGVEADSAALGGINAVDNANNWVLFGGNSMTYVNYYKQTVSGTLIVHYQPDSMITSTTVPDLEGAAQNGTITWGTNSNLTITMMGITPYVEYVSESGADDIADTIKPAEMPDTWYSDITDIADLPFYETFNEKATEMGMPTQTLYVMMMLGTAVAVGLGVLVFTGSALVAVLVCGVTIAAGVNTGILSGWMMLIFFIFGIGILYLSRQN